MQLIDLLLSLDQEKPLLQDVQFHRLDALVRVRDLILGLHQTIATRTVVEIVERVLHDGGLIPPGGTMHPLDLAALQVFFDRVRGRMTEEPAFAFADSCATSRSTRTRSTDSCA